MRVTWVCLDLATSMFTDRRPTSVNAHVKTTSHGRRTWGCAADRPAGGLDGLRQARCPCPGGPVVTPCVIAAVDRRIYTNLRPLGDADVFRTGSIRKCVDLRMMSEPHLADQAGKLVNAPQSSLDRIFSLIAASKWTPYLEFETGDLGLIYGSGDFQRRAMQSLSDHFSFGPS